MTKSSGNITTTDSYLDKTSKLIPGEALALYLGLSGAVWAAGGVTELEKQYFNLWSAVVVGFVVVPLVLWKIQQIKSWPHHIVSVMGFVLWVVNIQYDRLPRVTERDSVGVLAASLLLMLFTAISPLLVPPKKE